MTISKARRYHPGDVLFLRQLKNFTDEKVSLWRHLLWVLFSWPPFCLLAWVEGERVGYLRINCYREVSIAITPECQGQKIGRLLLTTAQAAWQNPLPMIANVRRENFLSRVLFLHCGFTLIARSQHMLVFRWPSPVSVPKDVA